MSDTKQRFVVGFAITPTREFLLVKKLRPKWQAGHLNGIGGKIEEDETPIAAMRREASEEAGLGHLPWRRSGLMRGTNNDGNAFECYVFSAISPATFKHEQREDEPLGLYTLDEALALPHIANLEYLLPFVLCGDGTPFMELTY